jgi:hypothetical protein
MKPGNKLGNNLRYNSMGEGAKIGTNILRSSLLHREVSSLLFCGGQIICNSPWKLPWYYSSMIRRGHTRSWWRYQRKIGMKPRNKLGNNLRYNSMGEGAKIGTKIRNKIRNKIWRNIWNFGEWDFYSPLLQ